MSDHLVVGRPLRVAQVLHGLEMGGLERIVVELADRGRQRGVEPLVLSYGEDGPVRALLVERGLPLVWLGNVPGMSFGTLRRIASALHAFGADLAHAHDLGPWLNAVAARAVGSRTEAMATFHQLAVPRGKLRVAASVSARLSRALVACGREVHEELARWAPPAARLLTIDNGVPLRPAPSALEREQARLRLGVPRDAVAIGYLGRMHPEKGPDLLVEAVVRRFRDESRVHLVLIGAGPLEGALAAAAWPLGDRMHALGEVVHDATALLAGLDVYAQPSRREGRSLSMLEAMAAGLPTVAHRLPAVAELHEEGHTALLVPAEDVGALGDALASLVADAPARARLGAEARTRVQRFSVEEMVDAYVAVYRSGRSARIAA